MGIEIGKDEERKKFMRKKFIRYLAQQRISPEEIVRIVGVDEEYVQSVLWRANTVRLPMQRCRGRYVDLCRATAPRAPANRVRPLR